MAQVVYSGDIGTGIASGTLFAGTKFWLSHRCPMRPRFSDMVKSNGGEVVLVEKLADIKIADHLRKDCAPETFSYTYIEKSVANGVLEDLEDHRAGPHADAVGSVGTIARASGTRISFTVEDDCFLYDWMEDATRRGARLGGNNIYQQLEAANPRHPYQSWRDRYLRYVKDRPRPVAKPVPAPSTPPVEQPETGGLKSPESQNRAGVTYTKEDREALLRTAASIEEVDPETCEESWSGWARLYPHHTKEDWQHLWNTEVRPAWLSRQGQVEDKKPYAIPGTPKADVTEDIAPSPVQRSKSPGLGFENYTSDHGWKSNQGDEDYRLQVRSPTLITTTELGLPKRKRSFHQEILPDSSPPSHKTTSLFKRPRITREREIPSTPEKHFGSRPVVGVDLPQAHCTDLELDPFEAEEQDILSTRAASQTLSEPDRSGYQRLERWKVVDNVDENSEDLDRRIAETSEEDGFIESKDEYAGREEDANGSPWAFSVSSGRDDMQTPDFDFDMPEPDGEWGMPAPPSSPPLPLTPKANHGTDDERKTPRTPTLTQAEINAKLDEWIDKHLASGISFEKIELALKSTSMDPYLAETVLLQLQRTGMIPTAMKGVWTAEDDNHLASSDAREIDTIMKKHGAEGLTRRFEFLKHYNESAE